VKLSISATATRARRLDRQEDASSLRPDVEEGRWVVTARHRRRAWEIVVEPDEAERVLVVITA